MGVGPFSHWDDDSSTGGCTCSFPDTSHLDRRIEKLEKKIARYEKLPNPRPSNYICLRQIEKKDFTILVVKYPDAKNFEGEKILVFDDPKIRKLIKEKRPLDPHFSDKNISPIARFRPDQIELAESFVHFLMLRR